jgi:hypothetical protein
VFSGRLRPLFERVLPMFGTAQTEGRKVSMADLSASQVVNLGLATNENAYAGTERTKRFPRTREELRLGLTIEQAQAARVISATPKAEKTVVCAFSSAVLQPGYCILSLKVLA